MDGMEIFSLVVTVLCGLMLFLYGMKIMSDGLEATAGAKLKSFLDIVSKNRFVGLITGTVITMLIQSSSATTVMVVGFVNAGLLKLTQAVGVIMGASVGTTITGVIVSLHISEYTPIAIIIGIFMIISAKHDSTKYKGQALAGFGILFLGMTLMGDSLKPLAEIDMVKELLQKGTNPFIGLLVGLGVTALIQSSSAVTGILITMAGSGLIDLPSAIFIIYGTNIGTCVTALLASIGTTKDARRAAVIHVTFKTFGAVLFTIITVATGGANGAYVDLLQKITSDPAKQIAIAHVIFAVTAATVVFPFANILVTIANKVIPHSEDEGVDHKRLLHLDDLILNSPHIVIEQTHKEVERMSDLAIENYKLSVDTFLNRNTKHVDKIKSNEELINFLNHEITKFLVKESALKLDEHDRKMIGSLHHIINDLERIGDHAENIMEFSNAFIEDKNLFSEKAVKELKEVTDATEQVLSGALKIFGSHEYNKEAINKVCDLEQKVDDYVVKFRDNHIERLNQGKCNATSGMLFINMLSDLERVSDHAKNIATAVKYEK